MPVRKYVYLLIPEDGNLEMDISRGFESRFEVIGLLRAATLLYEAELVTSPLVVSDEYEDNAST